MTEPTKNMLDAGYNAAHELATKNGYGLTFRLAGNAVQQGILAVYHAMESVRVADLAKAKVAAAEAAAAAHPTTAPGVAYSGVAPSDNATPKPSS